MSKDLSTTFGRLSTLTREANPNFATEIVGVLNPLYH